MGEKETAYEYKWIYRQLSEKNALDMASICCAEKVTERVVRSEKSMT